MEPLAEKFTFTFAIRAGNRPLKTTSDYKIMIAGVWSKGFFVYYNG
jgi:hypothetical protein